MKKIFKKLIKNIVLPIGIFPLIGLFAYGNDLVNLFQEGSQESIETVIAIIDQNGMEEERFEFLKQLAAQELAQLLEELFRPEGGEAMSHWAYNPLMSTNELKRNTYYHKDHDNQNGFEKDHFYITPAVRASQYIIFFLDQPYILAQENNEQRDRAQKLAEALNSMNVDTAFGMLYGRFDARFLGDRDRLSRKKTNKFSKIQKMKHGLYSKDKLYLSWNYEVYTIVDGSKEYHPLSPTIFDANTVEARVPLKLIRIIAPYLNDELQQKIREEEDLMTYKGLRSEL